MTAAITIIYLFAYTPLKRVSWSCNIVGAIPGALPPVAGWAAARGSLSLEPWILFGIMFLWQLPHSLSIAKMYRDDYRRARLWLIPLDREGNRHPENPVIVASSVMLVLVGAMPTLMGFAGIDVPGDRRRARGRDARRGVALVRGPETAAAARRVMFASLLYLPVVLLAMVLDRA